MMCEILQLLSLKCARGLRSQRLMWQHLNLIALRQQFWILDLMKVLPGFCENFRTSKPSASWTKSMEVSAIHLHSSCPGLTARTGVRGRAQVFSLVLPRKSVLRTTHEDPKADTTAGQRQPPRRHENY